MSKNNLPCKPFIYDGVRSEIEIVDACIIVCLFIEICCVNGNWYLFPALFLFIETWVTCIMVRKCVMSVAFTT